VWGLEVSVDCSSGGAATYLYPCACLYTSLLRSMLLKLLVVSCWSCPVDQEPAVWNRNLQTQKFILQAFTAKCTV
jgi:hypothetical protein